MLLFVAWLLWLRCVVDMVCVLLPGVDLICAADVRFCSADAYFCIKVSTPVTAHPHVVT